MSVWDQIWTEFRKTHETTAALQAFCPLADDLVSTQVKIAGHACTDRLSRENFGPTPYAGFLDAVRDASDAAHWRQTYAGTDIGEDFMARFGCYCLVGPEGAWTSEKMAAFFVYMPPDLWYTWHSHPAEELYFVIAGGGRFYLDGEVPDDLGPGGAKYHPSNRAHALKTGPKPLMALVLWRNYLDIPPTLMPEDWSPQ